MGTAKQIVVKPISSQAARRVIKELHYSGKVVSNSQVHFGVFLDGRCGGALQLGPPMRRDMVLGLVEGTKWNEMIELNRMALADWLPRNGESRVLGVTMRLLRKHYPHLKWVLTFADGCQCGDGTIYRASGFVLTAIKQNDGLRRNRNTGEVLQRIAAYHRAELYGSGEFENDSIWEPLSGFQLRYIYFLQPSCRQLLTVPELPYSDIAKHKAGMYRGVRSVDSDTSAFQAGESGANPTRTLL